MTNFWHKISGTTVETRFRNFGLMATFAGVAVTFLASVGGTMLSVAFFGMAITIIGVNLVFTGMILESKSAAAATQKPAKEQSNTPANTPASQAPKTAKAA